MIIKETRDGNDNNEIFGDYIVKNDDRWQMIVAMIYGCDCNPIDEQGNNGRHNMFPKKEEKETI